MIDLSPQPFWKRLLVPTDFSELSMAGLREAARFHRLTEADVVLLHVTEPSHGGLRIQTEGIHRRMEQEALACLHRLSYQHFPYAKNIIHVVVAGKPATAICKAAVDYEVDAILIPTHGITGLKQTFLGSVTQKVVKHAKCSVLVVRES